MKVTHLTHRMFGARVHHDRDADRDELGDLTLGDLLAQLGTRTDLAQLAAQPSAAAHQAAPSTPRPTVESLTADIARLKAQGEARERALETRELAQAQAQAREEGRAYGRGEEPKNLRPLPANETDRAQRLARDQLAAQARAEGADYGRQTTGGK